MNSRSRKRLAALALMAAVAFALAFHLLNRPADETFIPAEEDQPANMKIIDKSQTIEITENG